MHAFMHVCIRTYKLTNMPAKIHICTPACIPSDPINHDNVCSLSVIQISGNCFTDHSVQTFKYCAEDQMLQDLILRTWLSRSFPPAKNCQAEIIVPVRYQLPKCKSFRLDLEYFYRVVSGGMPCIHTCMHTYIHTFTYIHTYIHACINAEETYMHTYMHTYIYIHTCIHMCIHTCLHKCRRVAQEHVLR